MSMVEWKNTVKLLKIRLSIQRQVFLWMALLMAFLFLEAVVRYAGAIFRADGFRTYHITDNSWLLLILALMVLAVKMLRYRHTNAALAVFPHTDNARFVSNLLANLVWAAVGVGMMVLGYSAQYGFVWLAGRFSPVYLALTFSPAFFVTGALVYFMYIALGLAVMEVVGAALRKWMYYAVVLFTAVAAIALLNFAFVLQYAPYWLSFLMQEGSIALFFAKALGLFAVLVGAAFLLNRTTVYYKSNGQLINKRVVIICVSISLGVAYIIPTFFERTRTTLHTSHTHTYMMRDDMQEFFFDVSHLPIGTRIDVQLPESAVLPTAGGIWHSSGREMALLVGISGAGISGALLYTTEILTTLRVTYMPSTRVTNGIEMSRFQNSQFDARLEGTTLIIDFTYHPAQVVTLPVWTSLRQFDAFRDRGIFTEHPRMHTGSGMWFANTFINLSPH